MKINRPDGPATERQIEYLDSLSRTMVTLSQKATSLGLEGADDYLKAATDVVDALAGYQSRGNLTKGNASRAIDYIVESNRTISAKISSHSAAAPTTSSDFIAPKKTYTKDDAGVYRAVDGSFIRIYYGQQSGVMLAKRMTVVNGDLEYQYVGLADRHAKKIERKLTLDEAKKIGKATGTCCVCGRRLDDPESVDAGIGPVCAGKF